MTNRSERMAEDGTAALRLVLDCLPRGIVVTDLDGVILVWNKVAERLYGWTADEVIGRSAFELFLVAMSDEETRRLQTLVGSGEAWRGDVAVTRRDGATETTFAFFGPLRDPDGGVVGLVSAADEAVDYRLLEQRAADLTEHLVLALAAGDLGTWRWDMATGVTVWDSTTERIFGLEPGTFDGTYEAWVTLLHPDDVEATLATLARAVVDKQPYEVEHRVVWPDGSVHWLRGRGQVTVDAHGMVTGTLGCTGDETARKLLEVATAERARDAEQAAGRERLQRERLEFLVALNDAALAAADHGSLMRAVTAAAVPRLGDWCSLHFLPETSGIPEVEVAHADPAKVHWAQDLQERIPYDPNAPTGVPAVIRTGRLEFIRELDDAFLTTVVEATRGTLTPEELQSILDVLQLTSIITAPLRTKRGVVGAMQFVSAESGRRYDQGDVALAVAAAGRVADALDTMWTSEQHRRIATTLQAALLPPRLPSIDGVDLAVRYWPAGVLSNVGGDFYDVFPIGERRWAIVIGDVCGTGVDAAAVTAIARHTIRAAAMHGASAPDVLAWTNLALHAGHRDRFCTAIYATLEQREQGTWQFAATAAGHPPPFVACGTSADDPSVASVGRPGTLLGVLPELRLFTAEVTLDSGDTVMLYTDGVTDAPPPNALDPEDLARSFIAAAAASVTAENVALQLGADLDARQPLHERTDDLALVIFRIQDPFR